ncbi:T9SS type A sorting domain-containing protein [bacterium AH-315-C07]|nr:T9SS type A sorting domain-containing protein [bacterium AH-315-C07]
MHIYNKLVLSGIVLVVAVLGTVTTCDYNPVSKYTPLKYGSSEIQGIAGAFEYWHSVRMDPNTGKVDPALIMQARQQANNLLKKQRRSKTSTLGIKWNERGPDNVGGRTRAILLDKDDPSIMFAGAVAGGLWRSKNGGASWEAVNDTFQALSVVSICQTISGDIYFGTGEGEFTGTGGDKSTGMIGGGIWKSTDRGETWTHLSATTPSSDFPSNTTSDTWAAVLRLAAHQSDGETIYAATKTGLRVTEDGGITWNLPSGTIVGSATEVEVGSDGTVIARIGARLYRKAAGASSFENRSGLGGFPINSGRFELAIAPSDPNYMYCAYTAGGSLHNIYQSTDAGETWTVIGAGGAPEIFDPFSRGGSGGQGWYDNTIAVNPSDRNRIYVGGIYFWGWTKSGGWKKLGSLNKSPTNAYYVHADNHTLAFHPTNSNIMFIGNDGGVYQSANALSDQPTFVMRNNGYNVTQFYGVAMNHTGDGIIGGTQDNGTLLIDGSGNTSKSATNVAGGDGGYAEISKINPLAMFGGSPAGSNGALGTHFRSPNGGNSFSSYYDTNIDTEGDKNPGAPFVMNFHLWESFNDRNSIDSIKYIVCDTCSFSAGDTIKMRSNNNRTAFDYISTTALSSNDTIMIQDIVQAKMFLGVGSSVWMTRECIKFEGIPEWFRVDQKNISSTILCMQASEDGDALFIGTYSGIYRISGLSSAKFKYDGDSYSASNDGITTKNLRSLNTVCGIGLLTEDPNVLVVTLGGYNNSDHIYVSMNALDDAPTFNSIHGNLPYMPVYDAVVFDDPTKPKGSGFRWVVLGTDQGVYATNFLPASGNPTWYEENNGHPRTPTHQLRQYSSSAYPWITWGGLRLVTGTHGRGFFTSESFLTTGLDDDDKQSIANIAKVKLYPNPVTDQLNISYDLVETSNIQLSIYNINGQQMKHSDIGRRNTGDNQLTQDVTDLPAGTYFVVLNSPDGNLATSKFIKTKR